MTSLVKREKGTITVLLVLILIPSLIWTGLIVDYVRFQALEEMIGSAADLGLNAVLANYNHLLKQNFGLWATGATEENQAVFERYLHGTLDVNDPIYDSLHGVSQFFTANMKEYDTVYGSPELDCQLVFLADSTLNNPQILNQQIMELQKYRTPLEGIGVLADLLPEFEEMSAESQITNRMARIEQSLTELNNAYFTLYQNLQETMQFDDQRWHDFSANGEKRFGEIDRYFEDIWFLRRQLGASVDLEVEDYVIEEQIELKVQGIQNQANQVLSQQARDLSYYQSFSERSIDAQLQTEDIIRISKSLSTSIEEMRTELMNPSCSAELRSRIEDQLKACTGAIIPGDFAQIDTQIEWNQKVLASLSQATNRVYYEITGTRVTLATLKGLNAKNYCRRDVSLPVVPQQQMSHQLAVSEVTDSSLLKPLLQTAVGIALQNRYGSLAESSDYLRMIKKAKKLLEMGNAPNNDENAIKKIPENLWQTLPSQVANAKIISEDYGQAPNAQVDGLVQQLQNIGMVIRNRLYLEEYLAHMFSYQTITQTTVDCLGHSISRANNYLYGSELEYLLFGSATTGINKGLAEASVFGIRFMLNYQYAMTNQELTQLVQGIAASLGAMVGVAQPILQAIIRTAIVTAETACDLKQLLNGEAVVFWKSQESWQLSPSTIYAYFQGDAEEILPATEREEDGLTVNYHDYLRMLLFCPNQEKLLYRLMDLIELNLNYRNGTEGVAFGVEQMNYRLCNAYTAIQAAIEGRLNYLFFPISFLRDFKMDPNGINLRIMRAISIEMVAKQESGMLTVELCLSLLLFITIMLFALNFINISITTYHTQLALNHTALEVAQYSYLYAISGLLSAEDQVHNQTSEMSSEVVDFASAISGVYNNLMGLAGGEAKVDDIREIYNQGQSAIENLQVLLKNPEKIYLSLLYLGSESIIEELKGQLLGLLVQNILPKYLKQQETDSYLLHQGVEAGLMGLSLARSKFLPDRESIELILEYHLLVDIPLWPQQELLIRQRAITRAWLWGNMDSDEVVVEQSMWAMSNFTRGKAIINAEVKNYQYKILNVPGLHALNGEADWEIIRIFSYDATKPTNDVEHFSELLAEHVCVLGDKVSKLNQLVVQDLNGDTKTLLNNSGNLIEQTIRIIVPEDIDDQEMRALRRLSQIYQGQVKIEIATGYGRAQTNQGDDE